MRDLLKTSTYGTMHFAVAVSVTYVISKDWRVALGIGLVEPINQTIAYAFHEHVWTRFNRVNPV